MAISRRLFLAVTASASLAGCLGGSGGETTETTTTASTTEATTTDAEMTTTEGGMDGATVQVTSHPDLGDILVGPDGRTLYMFDRDTEGDPMSTCSGGCASTWPPLTVTDSPTKTDDVSAALTTFERDDGSMQVAAGGWPLYYFAPDENPGDAKGQGVNDIWWVLKPDGTPIRPSETDDTETSQSYYAF
ncbi:COG4315 family predicted lipoprotein [Haladaptatus sp. ZSTT2]|uniref:COG4315 family predicted lipoprotein n=1 Tax=Haladaptatus sp. ZSTT2 TaxID=3120515 RepID=UPI00300F053B